MSTITKGAPNKNVKPKPVFKVDSPYTAVKWPEVDRDRKAKILDLLVELLEPLGKYRAANITTSKGKRSKKRKRNSSLSGDDLQEATIHSLPRPQISKHVTVGLNSTTRHLETFTKHVLRTAGSESKHPASPDQAPLAVIVLTQPTSAFEYAHIPILAAFQAASNPTTESPRVVPLDAMSERKLCAAMGIPRIGVLGVMSDAPGAAPLLEYVRDQVSLLKVPWVKETSEGRWLGTKIGTREVEGDNEDEMSNMASHGATKP